MPRCRRVNHTDMGDTTVNNKGRSITRLLGATALTTFALSPVNLRALAQETPAPESSSIEEIVVTATHRAKDVAEIPYNITAVSSKALEATGVTTIQDLATQIPNLTVTSSGNQNIAAQREIIRGLNASATDRSQSTEQNPVSTYLGNAPYGNFFQIEDLQRVEVLRGPQGTLYGAGTLGGAIRLIPNQPAFDSFEGEVSSGFEAVAHSSDLGNNFKAILNIPIADKLALRIDGSQQRFAGFIDQSDVFRETGGQPYGNPIPVNPNAPLTSPAQTYTVKDVNWSEALNWRAALRWDPIDDLDIVVAFNLSHLYGFGPNSDTLGYDGGPDPLAPTATLPATGPYQINNQVLQPFARMSKMSTMDISYDLGFATLSSTTSYFETTGQTATDATFGYFSLPYHAYYTGQPVNPRFAALERFDDSDRATTEEIRLVSNGGGSFDYTVGAYYQHDVLGQFWNSYLPGAGQYFSQPGVTVVGGVPGANNQIFAVDGVNTFRDIAGFGEVTWRPLEHLELVGGFRAFDQTLERQAHTTDALYALDVAANNSTSTSSVKFKFNATYEYLADQRAYFTFSQGFRRGGANAFALDGFAREPATLLDYKPDTVDNYELGVKGVLPGNWRYSADIFDDIWRNAQIGLFTPVNEWPVVVNAQDARSEGVELELSGNITKELTLSFGYSYTRAVLTSDFCLPAGDGSGNPSPAGDIPCGIGGKAGTELPSAPKHSGDGTLSWERHLGDSDAVSLSLNEIFKGPSRENLPTPGQRYPLIPGYFLTNVYANWAHWPFSLSFYTRNLFDRRTVDAVSTRITPFTPLDEAYWVGTPRTVGMELSYKW